MRFEWEVISHHHSPRIGGSNTHRAKVIGGWVVSNDLYTDAANIGNERNLTSSMVFIPDPEHNWEITN